MQRADVLPGRLRRLLLGRAAHRGTEVLVLAEPGEFHPGLDLIGRGIVGEVGHGGTHQRHELGVGVETFEGAVEEVAYQSASFGLGERGESVHEVHFRGGGAAPGDCAEHRPAQAEGTYL